MKDQDQAELSTVNNIFSPKVAALLMSLIVATIYVQGTYYYRCYMGSFEVPVDMFPITFEMTLIYGFVFIMELSTIFLKNIYVITLIILLAVGFIRFQSWLKKKKPNWNNKKNDVECKSIRNLFLIFPMMLAVIVYVVIAGMLPYIVATNSASAAKKKHVKYLQMTLRKKENLEFKKSISIVKSFRGTKTGVVILSSEKYIALYDGKRINVMPLRDIREIRQKYSDSSFISNKIQGKK